MAHKVNRVRSRIRKEASAQAVTTSGTEISLAGMPKRGFITYIKVRMDTAINLSTVRVLESTGAAAGNLREVLSYTSIASQAMSSEEDKYYEIAVPTTKYGGTLLVEVTPASNGNVSIQVEVEPAVDTAPADLS